MSDRVRVIIGDCREKLRELERGSVQCVVTSPPYFGLRDYDHAKQIGLEASPEAFVAELVKVFRAVRRVLRDDGTLWLNLGDKYVGGGSGGAGKHGITSDRNHEASRRAQLARGGPRHARYRGLKPKDLIGIPWRVALALQKDGWYLRSDIIWHKPAPLPESCDDRPTRAHEYVFLLSKSYDYFYDADAIRTPISDKTRTTYNSVRAGRAGALTDLSPAADRIAMTMPRRKGKVASDGTVLGANRRSVWSIASRPYLGSHTSTFPNALVNPCILAGSRIGDTVLDPFVGTGTVLEEAMSLGRRGIGIELDERRLPEIDARLSGTQLRIAETA